MVFQWVAYSSSNGLKLTTDTLEQFDHEVPVLLTPKRRPYLSSVFFFKRTVTWFSLKVLNKKSKSKKNFTKEEARNRTRDIHSLSDLYPSQ